MTTNCLIRYKRKKNLERKGSNFREPGYKATEFLIQLLINERIRSFLYIVGYDFVTSLLCVILCFIFLSIVMKL